MPSYSKSQINRAGITLVSAKPNTKEYKEALKIVNEWRICHAYPINTFVSTLRKKVTHLDNPLVAQRLKRLPTIKNKLQRYPDMMLSRMHDIGGVRAVVSNMEEVRGLQRQYQDSKRFSHELVRLDDYIVEPKDDGYRSVHLVYSYDNTQARNNLAGQYKGLRIELQIRTRLQHIWATAVETVGTMRDELLKSQRGSKQWLEFFELTSAALAHLEQTPPPKKYADMTLKQTGEKLAKLEKKLDAVNKMTGLSRAAEIIHSKNISGYYNLIELNTVAHTISIMSYSQDNLAGASKAYEKVEQRVAAGEPLDAVLVSAGKLSTLKQAYPNYFLDIKDFAEVTQVMIDEITK